MIENSYKEVKVIKPLQINLDFVERSKVKFFNKVFFNTKLFKIWFSCALNYSKSGQVRF